jgi:hypothetical protein
LAEEKDVTPFVWTVRVRTDAQRAITIHARNHAFSVGDPLSFRPVDDLPSSLEMMLGALAADLTGTFRALARSQRLHLDALEFAATCRLNNPLIHVGVIGEEGHPGIEQIEGTLYVAADAEEDTLHSLWEETQRRSPLYQTLQGAVPLSLRLQVTP